ncbi:MAG: hypothetical protein Q9207_008400, partial [Kuettlingeria erythrocarpa]
MVRNPLMGLIIAATGDFGSGRSHEKLRQWVEKNGGQWATKMSEDVTHLICTKEDYRTKAPMGTYMLSDYLQFRGIDSMDSKACTPTED